MAAGRTLTLLVGVTLAWMVSAGAPTPVHAATPAQKAAIKEENDLHRRNLLDLDKLKADAKADRDIGARNCQADHECVRRVVKEYSDRLREIANQGSREDARHQKQLLDISKGETTGAPSATPATGDVFSSSGAGTGAGPATGTGAAQDPFKLEAVHDAPLDWIPNTLNALADTIPDGAQRLQAARQWSDEAKRPYEERWTKDPAGGIHEVGEFVAMKGAGKVVGPVVGKVADKVADSPMGKSLAASAKRVGRTLTGAGQAAAKSLKLPAFKAKIDQGTRTALERFAKGAQGGSTKGLSRQIEGKTLQEIDDVIGQKGGGWRPPDPDGVVRSNDGKWMRIDRPGTANGQSFRQRFYVNGDGGVLRVKPDGMPSTIASMTKPHAGVTVLKNPGLPIADGGLDFDNEAFKVIDDAAAPKWPEDMEIPREINPVKGDPGFEKWLLDTGWSVKTHIPLK